MLPVTITSGTNFTLVKKLFNTLAIFRPSRGFVYVFGIVFVGSDGELGAGNLPEWPFAGGFRSVAGARAGRV